MLFCAGRGTLIEAVFGRPSFVLELNGLGLGIFDNEGQRATVDFWKSGRSMSLGEEMLGCKVPWV